MASVPNSAQIDLLVSRNSIRERVRDALRLHAGRGRRYSVQQLAEGSGVPATNIDNAMRVVDDPAFRALKLEELASVGKFLRAPFVSSVLELCGLGAFELMEEQQPLDGVLTTGPIPISETPEEERKRLIRRLAELEGVQ